MNPTPIPHPEPVPSPPGQAKSPKWLRWFRSEPVGPVRLPIPRRVGGARRLSATVDGHDVWFESPDAELCPASEALGSAFLVPALARRRPVHPQGPVCALWLENQAQAAARVAAWWGYPNAPPTAATRRPEPAPAAPAPGRTVLCFTGGVDSFYSLLHGSERPQAVAFVSGFDIDLRDVRSAAIAEAMVRRVAAAVGVEAIVLTTNLRRHPTFRAESWERTHGGALAAVAHFLADRFDRFRISATVPRGVERAWGSHWVLDGLHSSSRVRLGHVGEDHSRVRKLQAIAAEPLVQEHLRVCWQRHGRGTNCGRCEKCLRTMLTLTGCGLLDRFPTFRHAPPLPALTDALPSVSPWTIPAYREIRELGLPGPLDEAVRRLIERTTAAQRKTSDPRAARAA